MKETNLPSVDPRVETGLCAAALLDVAAALTDSDDPADWAELICRGCLTWETRSSGVLALTYAEGSDACGYREACVATVSVKGRVALYV